LAASSLREKVANFLVTCLGKIFVPFADSVEAFRDHHCRHLIGFALDLAIARSCNDRCGDYNVSGVQLSQR
jgi:hypothetical protein